MILVFFVLTGVAPYGLNVDLTYPLVHLSLDLSLQYAGIVVALGLVLGWNWARIGGRIATWALLVIVAIQLFTTLVAVLSGSGTLQFIVLWPMLTGDSPIAFLIVGAMVAGYLYWQSATLGTMSTGSRTEARTLPSI